MVNVTLTNIQAYSPAYGIAEFVSQTIDPITGQLTIQVYTSVQSPFMFVPLSPTVLSGQFTASSITLVNNSNYICNMTATNICEQLWQVVLTPTVSQCTYNGSLAFNFTLVCQPIYPGLCTAQDFSTLNISADIQSGDYCANVIENVNVNGVLQSYQDAAMTNTDKNFIYNMTAYFMVQLTGPSITAVNVQRVIVYSNTTTILLPSSPVAGFVVSSCFPNQSSQSNQSNLI